MIALDFRELADLEDGLRRADEFVVRVHRDGAGTMVDVTAAGRAFLIAEGRTRGTTDRADFTEG